MNNRQESKVNMSRTVEGICLQYSSVYAGNVAFKTAFEAFQGNIADILSTAQQDASVITGITADKNILKDKLCSKASELANVTFAYASTTGNNTLKEEVNFTYSKLARLREESLAPNCQNIHDKIVENITALADYGITSAMTTELQQLIDRYSAETPKVRTAISNRKATTASMVTLFEEMDDILKNRMDKIVVIFEAANPEFVAAYNAARRIVEPVTITTQLKGVVTDKLDAKPIKGAVITAVGIENGNTGESFTATTDADGEYHIKPIIYGKYNITVSATGYATLETDAFQMIMGNINHLNAIMVK